MVCRAIPDDIPSTEGKRLSRAEDFLRRFRIGLRPGPEIARLEALAEKAYAAMYEAPRHGVRDCYDDASSYLAQAIRLAERARMTETAERLRARKEHIYKVYDRQFR
jgi:hypothetical protein